MHGIPSDQAGKYSRIRKATVSSQTTGQGPMFSPLATEIRFLILTHSVALTWRSFKFGGKPHWMGRRNSPGMFVQGRPGMFW